MNKLYLAVSAALLAVTAASAQSVFESIVPEAEPATQDISTNELRRVSCAPVLTASNFKIASSFPTEVGVCSISTSTSGEGAQATPRRRCANHIDSCHTY